MSTTTTEDEQLKKLEAIVGKQQPTPAPTSKPTTAQLLKPTLTTKITPKDQPYNPTEFFIPEISILTAPSKWRIAIVGGPGSGKTTSCLTFPHRLWCNLDNKIPAGERELPFWNSVFCDSLAKRTYSNVVNRRDAVKFWLRDNHYKLHEDQTLLIDSWTLLMNAFEIQTRAEDDVLDANDKSNKYYLHAQRMRYCMEIFSYLHACRCRVVVTFHEAPDRDKEGELNGKIRPVMDGSFKDQLFGHFTDFWRQKSNIYETETSGVFKRDPVTKQKVVKHVNHKGNPRWVWFWQLLGDADFDTNCQTELGKIVRRDNKDLVPADFEVIMDMLKKG